MPKILITIGIILIIVGLLWPWLQKLGLFRLPGDVAVERENFSFYFPITTMLIISVVITIIIWLFRR